MSNSAAVAPALAADSQALQRSLESLDLNVLRAAKQFNNPRLSRFLDGEEDYDDENDEVTDHDDGVVQELRDPAVVAAEVAAHLVRTSFSLDCAKPEDLPSLSSGSLNSNISSTLQRTSTSKVLCLILTMRPLLRPTITKGST
jgi:hypothetical protein